MRSLSRYQSELQPRGRDPSGGRSHWLLLLLLRQPIRAVDWEPPPPLSRGSGSSPWQPPPQGLLTPQEREGAVLQLHHDPVQHRQHGGDVQQHQDDGLGDSRVSTSVSHQRGGGVQRPTCSFPNTSPLAML